MTGNTLTEFINDLLIAGGPEKEFVYHEKKFFLESIYHDDKELIEMHIFEISNENTPVISFFGKNFQECVKQFEEAHIFDGKTIYDVEKEITVLFG